MMSFEKVNYAVRPCKQVERKLFIEAFRRLARLGYDFSDYTYIGFGSVFYIDFILFHKYLDIDSMVCFEHTDTPKRMKFNRPYGFIKLKMQEVSDAIPALRPEVKYLVWLDYDRGLDAEILAEVIGFIRGLPAGCFLLISVESEVRLIDPIEQQTLSEAGRVERMQEIYRESFSQYMGAEEIHKESFNRKNLPSLQAKIIFSAIQAAVAERSGLNFQPLFNLAYRDSAQMLTVGGLLDTSPKCRALQSSGVLRSNCFQRENRAPVEISVPPLTIREKNWLDSKIMKDGSVGALDFELDRNLLANYKRFYKHYPVFQENFI